MDGMGVGDVCEKGSPGLASSSTTPSEPKEDGHVILIPHSHIFALMLQALKLPPANYHHKTYPEDSAAIAAIRFMENACGKEIRDYHYTHVERLENQVTLLERYLDEAKKRIKKVRKGWFYAVRYMSSYSTQIQNTTAARRLRGQDSTKGAMKTALASTRKLAKRLRCIGLKSEQCLETTDSIW
ncbi:hypothetical protein CFC21_099375 [Triticum aestivum]|uniref:Uncharacterized protein n=3 Tax=Triticum TaxID=4564 RepID=A0A1D6SBV6_WHEAT|nr:uncharacterized protein LOC119331687 isoform X1 [Triticum dicoccoides]XP_037460747.1 uncharacterized protein LOC119331687 isoform X1 [Triticum dicoccoides]XP_044424170.1 uncharacterized protein LOC123148744 isoform X2 [Triticum aestivum]XP_044424171.1 uncharacterized protein LOC123148744 isoform X2 [Triticum aestivum]VAI79224.1 unnamed protein product [Triticum turgidum subsp. durum]KAF7097574.1 hypothetical protein CFC21_099375 [Triticum aestivum]